MDTGRTKWQSFLTVVAMILSVVVVLSAAWYRGKQLQKISYDEHMDDVAVTVDGREYPFRELAFYLAHQEMETEEQAKVYDLKNPHKYWNLHTNGSFVKIKARDFAMDMAVHDVIFYEMALEDGIELTTEEYDYMENQKMDFWNDIEEEGQKRLGISESEMETAFERMALAQKEQQFLADFKGVDYREYDVNGELYQELLKEHSYEVNENLWERLNFGKIILD